MERGPHSWSQGVLRHARRHFQDGTGMESHADDIFEYGWSVPRAFRDQ